MNDEKKKFCIFVLAALLLALIAYATAETAQQTADNATNITNVFEIVVNNTDLFAIGQRSPGITYYANNYPIEISVIFHVVGTGAAQNIDTNLTVNGSVVVDNDFRTTAGSGVHEHVTSHFIIPKNSSYFVTNSSNVYTIEWREYPILSGRNGTLSLNQSIVNTTTNNYYNNTTAGLTNNSLLNSSTVNVTKNANGTVSFNTNISNMSIVTSSRTAGTVYRNNFNIPIYVSVSVTCSTTATILATIGNTSTPSTNIVLDDAVAATRYSGFFIVIPGYFYKVACNAGSTTIIQWTEWN